MGKTSGKSRENIRESRGYNLRGELISSKCLNMEICINQGDNWYMPK